MPFALIIVGTVLLIASARNTLSNSQGTGLYQLLATDFTGQDNFIFWALAILLIGAIGYVPKLKPLSVAFMTLVIIVLVLRKGTGVFSQFVNAIGTTQSATPSIAVPSSSASSSAGGGASSGGLGSALGSLGSLGSVFNSSDSGVSVTGGSTASGGITTGPNLPSDGGVASDLSSNPLSLPTFSGLNFGG
jgi:hypothetical protein